jgi:kynurenine formamidase
MPLIMLSKEAIMSDPSTLFGGDALRVFDLEQPRTERMPIHPSHRPGYSYVLHRRHQDSYGQDGPRTGASGMIVCMEHTGTHIDALCHQAADLVLHGGIEVSATVQGSRGFTQHSIEHVPPIVAPGVLLDMAAYQGVEALPEGYAVSAAELQACCERQGVAIQPGDVVLVYTGNERAWDDEACYLRGPGMAGDASRWLAKQGVVAVGADNMAWDVLGLQDSELGCTLPGHVIFLVQHGIYIIENLRLSELAASHAYRFTFICTPLKFVGATGSPVRPIAVINTSSAVG